MVLVVGGAGFIGSHMVKALLEAGRSVTVFDNLEKGHRSAVKGAEVIVGDLRDKESLKRAFAGTQYETVYHFAAYIEVGESVKEPAKFVQNNLIGTYNLLEAVMNSHTRQFVFSSTAAVYGEPQEVPITEDHPKNPTNPYGDTKLAVERMLTAYDSAYGLKSVVLRYFNAAGCDPNGALGEDHEPETHLVPRFLQFVQGKTDFTIFGKDYDTPDGTCVRDYIHVCDLADAHMRAADYLAAGGLSTAFNLGNGTGFSVLDVVHTAEKVTGQSVEIKYGPRREGDPAKLVASNSKARDVLGWRPQFDDLETMIRHTWNWQLKHPNGYGD